MKNIASAGRLHVSEMLREFRTVCVCGNISGEVSGSRSLDGASVGVLEETI